MGRFLKLLNDQPPRIRKRLLLPLADSLAGRMEIIRLFPVAQCEIERAVPRFLGCSLDADPPPRTTPAARADFRRDSQDSSSI